ncbi:HAD family hydrolase [Tepidamorphus sp. 3E244]|uniref:HAD family hydrolase n=1 Tax=Tepidamorphus sp. 3E244 TaxID=3385498 RepID=UPI0038FD01C4
MPATPAIVFDVGNVLLDWQPERIYHKTFPDEAERARFMADVVPLSWHEKQDAGRTLADGIAERVALFPQHEEPIRDFYRRWLDTIVGEIPGTVKVLEDLIEQGYPVHAITNFSAELWPLTVEAYPFLGWFGVTVVSGQERVLKPDPAIFNLLLDRTGLAASDCIFIDDRSDNCEAARALGFRAIEFTRPETLSMDLVREGVRLPIELA